MGASKEADLGHAEETGVERRMEEQVGSDLEGRAGTGLEEDLEACLGESLGSHRVPPRRRSSWLQVDCRRGLCSADSILLLRLVTSESRKVDSENYQRIALRKLVEPIIPCDNGLLASRYRYRCLERRKGEGRLDAYRTKKRKVCNQQLESITTMRYARK